MSDEPTVLKLSHVSVEYGRDRALEDASITVERGDFVGIVGPNGSGKTTLLRSCLGLAPIASGAVELFGEDIRRFHAWRRVGYVPQNASQVDPVFPATALDIAMLGLVPGRGLMRWLREEDRAAAMKALEEVDAGHLARRRIGELSGGERQRVLLAKALAAEPELLFLDEPTTGVDPQARADFHELLDHLNHDHGLTVLLVSHDTRALAETAHRIVGVNRRIVFDDTSRKFRTDAMEGELYNFTISHGERNRHLERGTP